MIKNIIFPIIMSLLVMSCASVFKDYDEKLLENKEFSDQMKVEEIPQETPVIKELPESKSAVGIPSASIPTKNKKNESKTPVTTKTSAEQKKIEPIKVVKHEPPEEDSEGFIGRRPAVDPFVAGEELTYGVSYFAVEAGKMTMTTHPFVEVNGKKAYHFGLHATSSSVFSLFYAVDDRAEAYLDYNDLIPYSYSIQARETKQVRDVKSYFNWKTLKGKTWDKKIKKGKGPEEKNYEWDILPYSQNVFTVAFYLRCFQYAVGKELSVRVAHEGENIVMKAKVLREEKLSTSAGKFDAYVIKPEFVIDGVFKPVGDVFMWVSKDQYHRILRIESKIKIGKIVVGLQQIKP